MIKINETRVEVNKFPDGTLLIKNKTLCEKVLVSWFFENNEELVSLIYIVNHMRRNGVKEIHLFMPYIPNARQDRVKSAEDVFTLKYFAEVINYLHFDKVIVLDPHSSVSEALFDNIEVESPKPYVEQAYEDVRRSYENTFVFYPDEGAMKRYSGMLSVPYTFGIKNRDWYTGKINGLSVSGDLSLIKGKNILIVDDICSRGGTFYHSAKKLKELGANKIFLYVTHCENTILDGEVLTSGLIEQVYTTDSILTVQHEKIEVIHL